VDIETKSLRVDVAAIDGRLGPPKTKTSTRRVALSPRAAILLAEQILVRPPNDLDLVFPSSTGRILRKDNFMSRVFRPAVERTGLGRVRFHDLRHTYAALMIRSGAHPKILQSQLGHSSITVTLDRYGHLYPDAFAEVGEALDRVVAEQSPGCNGVATG
jgi:integrase